MTCEDCHKKCKGFNDANVCECFLDKSEWKKEIHAHWSEDEESGDLACSNCGHFTSEIIGEYRKITKEEAEAFGLKEGSIAHCSLNPKYCSRCGAKKDGGND